ncbi:MAG: PQQ-binding-like beta-propeller repeat protein [Fimbriimonas sp.]|nr:PQQ-binding-like beta-propeller repeat protein [Fimbriimonas sp.]
MWFFYLSGDALLNSARIAILLSLLSAAFLAPANVDPTQVGKRISHAPKVGHIGHEAAGFRPFSYQVGSSWPKFQNDNRNSGLGTSGGSNGQLRWSNATGDNFYFGSPVIGVDGTVYVAGLVGSIYAISNSGTRLWAYTATGDSFKSSPAIGSDGTLYAAGALGNVYAISSSGSVTWKYATGDVFYGAPSVATDGTVYVAGTSGGVFAISSGGSPKWSVATGDSFDSACPAIDSNGNIYVAGASGKVYSISPSGSVNWTYSDFGGEPFYGSVSIAPDNTIYAASTYAVVYAINPSGTAKWDSFNSGGFYYGAPAIGSDGTIYVADGYGQVYAISANGSSKWSYTTTDTLYGSPSIGSDGTIYVEGYTGGVYAFSPTGTFYGAYNPSDHFYGSTAIGPDGALYASSVSGVVYAVGTEVNTVAVGTLSLSPTTVVGGNSSTGTVTLASAAPSGGDIVTLLSGDPSASVPAFVYVPPGATQATFTVSTAVVAANASSIITATSGGVNATALLTVESGFALNLNPSTILGGSSTTGTVTLGAALGTDTVVTLGNQWPAYVTVPATVTIPAGSTSATFAASTSQMYMVPFTNQITATIGATIQSATLTVASNALNTITLNPTSVHAGSSSTGTVTLWGPAPVGGWTVYLTSANPTFVSVPTSVTVTAGATSATFAVTTQLSCPNLSVLISAHDSVIYHSATLTIVTDSITGLTLNPTTIGAGGTSTGTVTLKSAAPTGGWAVAVSVGIPWLFSIPSTVTVPAGATSATFAIVAKATGTTYTSGVYVSDGHSGANTALTVAGNLISSLALNPTTIGGNGTSTGTVTLASVAPVGGWLVNLSSGIPSIVSLPASVTVPSGAATVTFTISAKQTTSNYSSGIYATDGNSAKSATLSIVGDRVTGLSLNPTTIGAGGVSTGTVTLAAPAPFGGWLVHVSAGVPWLVTLPATITVPAGATSTTFSITAKATGTAYTMGVYATDGNSSASATLTVSANLITQVSVSPTSVQGGIGATGAVTIASPAPPGGWLVNLSSGVPGTVGVPSSVVVPAGATSVTFPVTTKAVSSTLTVGIYASDGNSGQSTGLTVTH